MKVLSWQTTNLSSLGPRLSPLPFLEERAWDRGYNLSRLIAGIKATTNHDKEGKEDDITR